MRVLITVCGGIASFVADKGIEVEIFDWDNYRVSSPVDQEDMALNDGWKDLARDLGVPCKDDK